MDGITTAARRNTSIPTLWHWAQVLAWAGGMAIWVALIVWPPLGLHLLWNVLIPVAPALLVLAPGVWRNLCPLGSMSLAPHHFGLSQRKTLTLAWRGRLYLGALILLLVVVPLADAGPSDWQRLCRIGDHYLLLVPSATDFRDRRSR